MASQESSQPVFIVGPTASGKSAAAMNAAREFPGSELLCLDKCTAWAEMDIGTAKPNTLDRNQVPHQLVDIFHMGHYAYHWPPGFRALNDKFGAYPDNITAIMLHEARTHLNRLARIGDAAICVGGSAALYAGLHDGHDFPMWRPRSDPRLREISCWDAGGMRWYLNQKGITAPFAPNDILGNNDDDPGILFEQIVEAETRSITGAGMQGALVVGISVEDETLQKRIYARTDQMIQQGLEAEVESLVEKYGWVLPLRGTVGYKEFRGRLLGRLENFSLDGVITNINASTLRYARRQSVWLKQRQEVQWVRNAEEATELVIRALGRLPMSRQDGPAR